jgi:predicted nucleotidyltransferase
VKVRPKSDAVNVLTRSATPSSAAVLTMRATLPPAPPHPAAPNCALCETSGYPILANSQAAQGVAQMRPSLALDTHRESIRAIALRHRVTNVRVFGSVVHGDDTDGSDLDLLVEPTSETTMMDIAKIQLELSQLLPVAVDVLTPNGLPAKFRRQVELEALPV